MLWTDEMKYEISLMHITKGAGLWQQYGQDKMNDERNNEKRMKEMDHQNIL